MRSFAALWPPSFVAFRPRFGIRPCFFSVLRHDLLGRTFSHSFFFLVHQKEEKKEGRTLLDVRGRKPQAHPRALPFRRLNTTHLPPLCPRHQKIVCVFPTLVSFAKCFFLLTPRIEIKKEELGKKELVALYGGHRNLAAHTRHPKGAKERLPLLLAAAALLLL